MATDTPTTVGQPDSITRNTLFTLAVQLTGAIFTAAITLYLVRALGRDGYGLYSLALAVGGLLTLPSDFGISASAMRFIAERRADPAAVARVIADALRLKLVLAGLVSALLFALSGPIADVYGHQHLVWPLRGVALALFGQSLMLLFGGAFVAQARASGNLGIVLAESATETVTTIALVLVGFGAAGATFGRAIGYAAGAGLGLFLTIRLLGRSRVSLRRASHGRAGEIARYAGSVAVVDWVFTFYAQLDTLLVGAFLTTAAVGLFQAPLRLITFFAYPGTALAGGIAPRLARHEREEPNAAALALGLRILILLQAVLVAPLVVWATPLARLVLGADYGGSAAVLRAIAPFAFLAGIGPLVSLSANYLGAARQRISIALATVAINLVLDLLLIPRIGIVGAAIGSDVAYAVYVPAHIWICARQVELPLRSLLVTVARSLVAACATAGVLLLAGSSHLSLAAWVAGSLGGLAAYAAALLMLRETSLRELSDLAGRVRRRLF